MTSMIVASDNKVQISRWLLDMGCTVRSIQTDVVFSYNTQEYTAPEGSTITFDEGYNVTIENV